MEPLTYLGSHWHSHHHGDCGGYRMGSDYALYLVRSYQRYMDEDHPSLGLIRLSVFLCFATTFMGFGALALSGHALLRNAGIALVLGIGYSFIGAVTLTPPL